jgi:hypothetical protein
LYPSTPKDDLPILDGCPEFQYIYINIALEDTHIPHIDPEGGGYYIHECEIIYPKLNDKTL